MTATVAEMKIEQLKRDLAEAEAAQQAKKSLTSELAEADKALIEAQRLVTLNKLRLDEAVAGLDSLSKESASVPQGMSGLRVNHDAKIQQAHQTVRELTVEGDRLAGELGKTQSALGQIIKKITEHPTYKSVREKQRGLVAEASSLASTLFKASLADMDSVLRKISLLSEEENRLIGSARAALSSAGVPEIKSLLGRFVQQISPAHVLDAVSNARKQVREAVDRVTESASRDVLR